MAGCGGILFFVYKGSEGIARTGADYLAASPEIRKAAGAPVVATPRWTGWRVNVVNDTGDAFFTYDLEGPGARGYAEAHLRKSGGVWTAVGGRFVDAKGSSGDVVIGSMPGMSPPR